MDKTSRDKLNAQSTVTLAEFLEFVREKVEHVDVGLITLDEAISAVVIKTEEF